MTANLTPHDSFAHRSKEWSVTIGTTMDNLLRQMLGDCGRDGLTGAVIDELVVFIHRPGKRVRPLLLLHAYRAFAGRDPGREIFQVAAALELLHLFILAHDDVVDRSDARGGQATLHRAIESRLGAHHEGGHLSQALAIVLGDMLFASAQRMVLHADLPAEIRLRVLDGLLEMMTATGLGECHDILAGIRDISQISPADVEHMYWLKTSLYTIECPLVLGALLAGCDGAVTEDLRALSRPLGLAFQIHNDLKAFRQFEAGTEIPDDFTEGKKTLLMAVAHQHLGEHDRQVLQHCLGQIPATGSSLATLRELVRHSGAADILEAMVARLTGEAATLLDQMPWPAAQRLALCHTLQFLGSVLDCQEIANEAAA